LLRNKFLKLLPEGLLWRLTLINVGVVASFIVLSSWAIYNTACFLADGLGTVNIQKQTQFRSTLYEYLWIFSIFAIVVGSLIHFYLIKKLMRPLKELIEATKRMKEGNYPKPIVVNNNMDEMGKFIGHFNDLTQQLKETQAQRKELIVDLSHEFRTPLSNLSGYLNALKNGIVQGDKKMYQSLYDQASQLIYLVEQLELLKEWDYMSKQTYSEKSPMDMKVLIEQSVEMFRWKLQDEGIEIKVQAESGKVNVFNAGIPQVISNLIDNAIRYYEASGPILITGEKLSSTYKFSISSSGEEIPIDKQEKIFERLYRIDASRAKGRTGGSGLGLAISKEIIEHHNGNIGVKSEGNYHTFWFDLPLSE
jgi:two-component system, OmpR family, sensor histidine kinase BaeS